MEHHNRKPQNPPVPPDFSTSNQTLTLAYPVGWSTFSFAGCVADPRQPLFIYVAGPYTLGDVAMNVRDAIGYGTAIRKLGHFPYVPHLTHFWHFLDPQPYDFWIALDNGWLHRCDAIIRIPGPSAGADAELARARKLGLLEFADLSKIPNLWMGANHGAE
jgi:hypothetical protein